MYRSARVTYQNRCGGRSTAPTSWCTPATGSTCPSSTRWSSRSRRLVGVHGNNDHGVLRERLPEVARVELDGLKLGVVHETGSAKGREQRCSAAYPDLDVLVFGHSHIPWDTTTDTGQRLLNPGSPTDRRRQPRATYLTATVIDARLQDVRLHEL